MTIGIKAKRERRLGLAPCCGAHLTSALMKRYRDDDRSCSYDRGTLLLFGLHLLHLNFLRLDFLRLAFLCRHVLSLRFVYFGGFVELFVARALTTAKAFDNFRPLIMDRRLDWSETRRMGARMLDDIIAERVVIHVSRSVGGLGRLETHVIPTKVLKAVADLTKALRTHGWARSALAGKQARRKRGEWLGFHGQCDSFLLTNNAAAEAANRARRSRGNSRRSAGRGKDGTAEILFEAV